MSDWITLDGETVSGLPDPGTTNRMSTLEEKGGLYKPNFRSFGEFIRSSQVRKPTAEVARAIARRAGELSPRRKHGVAPPGTALADRFRVDPEAGEIMVDRALRVKVVITNDAPSAAPNEFGNKRTKRHRMLGRAGADFGDFKPEGGPH
jgi:hypothetical protein